MPALGDSKSYVASLDGVRGVAISLVLVVHLLWASANTGSRVLDFISNLRGACWIGVDLFFALSGFLITGILVDTLESECFFRNFYARRILRIFPLYYGLILMLFLFLRPHGYAETRPFYLLLFYLQNTPLWWNFSSSQLMGDLVGHLWSLSVEEQFYLVWPLLVFSIRDRRRLLWATVCLAALAPISRFLLISHGASFTNTYELTICRADSLLGGAWLALAVRGRLRAYVFRFAPWFFALSMACCVAIGWRSGFDWATSWDINTYGYSVIAIGSISLIAMSLRPESFTASAMRVGFLRFLGKYSYGIYVYHQVIRVPLERYFRAFLESQIHSKVLLHLTDLIICLLIIIPIAVLSYHLYEAPFLKLKKYFSYSARRPVEFPLASTAELSQ